MMRSVRYIAWVLAAALLASLLPACALAAPAAYDVWVNGVRFTEANAAEGIRCGAGTAVYAPEEKLLTLTDAAVTRIHEESDVNGVHCASIFAKDDLTVAVYGDNSAVSVFSIGHNATNCGLYCGGELTITGTGTLAVTGGLSTFRTAGLYAGGVTLRDSVTVNAKGGKLTSSAATVGYGVYCANDLTVTDNAVLEAVSFQPGSEYLPAVSVGIFTGETLTTEKNAVVSATGNRSAEEAGDGILLRGALKADGGSLKARAVGENGCGIRIDSDHPSPLTVTAGFLWATGGQYALKAGYGRVNAHPEYRVTGASFYNASELGCDAEATPDYEGGLHYVITIDGKTVPAKSVYFVRPVIGYGLWVGGEQVTNYNCGDILGDGKAAYDAGNATLTLSGAQISGGRHENAYLYAEEALVLRLADGSVNTVGGFSHEPAETAYGVYAAEGLTVTGGGTLSAASGDAQTDAFGIYVRTGSLAVAGSVLQAKAGDAKNNSAGIYTASTVSGDVALTEMASVNAVSGKAAAMMGLSANGNISVTGASVLYGQGGSDTTDPASVSYGVRSGGAMDMDDSSSVRGVGGDSAGFSIGVYVLSSEKGVTVRGGTLTAVSGAGADRCYGLYAKTAVEIRRGALNAESGDASEREGSMSYAVTGKTVALSGGNVTATSGRAASGCAVYADAFTMAGAATLTASSDPANGHALRKAPKYTSYAPVVYAGKAAPGERKEAPTEATYVNSPYVRIEKLYRSEKIWYALPIYDSAGRYAARWIGFTSDDVTRLAQIGAGVEGTGAAEYYNGYIYGVTASVPFRFWRAATDGATLGAAEIINDSVRFTFGDMSYDYVTDKMYGLGSFNRERAIFSIDLNTGASQRVVSLSGTDGQLLTIAFDRAGDCYGVDLAGYLYRISLRNGKADKIGFTGLVPDGAQSMAFDRETGELFWAYYNGQTGKSGYYYVDTVTGQAVYSGQIGGAHMELAGLFTIPKAYDVWVGGVRVNEENYADVFGNRLVSFDPEAKTLTFNGMKITTFVQAYKNYSFGILARDMDLELIFKGENAIALENAYTDYSASICVINGKAKITGGKLTILNTTARLDNTILCPEGLTIDGCELMIYSNHNAVTVTGSGAELLIRNSTVGVQAGHVGLASVNGDVTLENSTLAVAADKDARVAACAVAARNGFSLKNSTFIATADTNVGVISGWTDVNESAFEVSGAKQAFSGWLDYFHQNGSAVVVSNEKSEESRNFWDKTTGLTNYNYVRITECPHYYDEPGDTECRVCGHIRRVTSAGETYLPGDPDGDGKVTSGDARLALRRSVGLEDYEEGGVPFCACDADGDGKVTSGDARLILRASVGLEEL